MKYKSLLSSNEVNDLLVRIKDIPESELPLVLSSLCELNNWKIAQDVLLNYVTHQNRWIAKSAITGLGHVARVHSKLDKDHVKSKLLDVAKKNQHLSGAVEDAFSDMDIFLGEDIKPAASAFSIGSTRGC